MLHIVNQYKKMIFSFLENNLNWESNASEVSSKLDLNKDKKISKKEMKDALDNPQLSEDVKSIISTIESKIKNFQHIWDFEKSYTAKFNALKSSQLSQVQEVATETRTQIQEVATETRSEVSQIHSDVESNEKIDISKIDVSLFTRTLRKDMTWADVQELNKFLIAKTKMFSLKELSSIDTFDSKTFTMLWNYQRKLWVQNPDGVLTISKGKEYTTIANIKKDVLNSPNNNSWLPVQELSDNQTVAHVDITWGTDNLTESNDTLDYNATLNLLSDLNSDSDLDDQNVVDEKSLKTALSQLSNGNKDKLLSIYKNVVWYSIDKIDWINSKIFHNKLVSTLQFMTNLGINSWLYSVLDWKTNDFAKEIVKLPIEKRKIEVSNIDKLSPWIQNAIWALVSAWVLILTQWVVAVSREVKQYDWNEVIEKIEKSKEGEPLSKLKQFLTFIKDAFTGRRLSFSISEDDTINVRKFEESITKFATWVLEFKFDWTDAIIEWLSQDKYEETLNLSKQFGLDINKPEDKKIIQWILIQDFILSEWIRRQWTDWKATLGLLFIWAHRDKIWVEYVPTVLNEDQAKIERNLTRTPLNSDVLSKIWISVNKVGEKFEHTLPLEGSMIRLPWDDREFPIKEIYVPEWVTMETLRSSDIKYDFHFSFVGWRWKDYYVLALTPSTSTSSWATWDVWPKQNISETINLREWKEVLSNKDLSQVLYDIVWHRVNFWKLAKAISRWDLDATKKELDTLSSQYKNNKEFSSYIDLLKQNISSFSIWDTYMSWNKETRKERSPNFDNVRSQAVIRAENALARASWFPIPGSENDFRVSWEYKSKQISEIFPGQEITSVQFMTPADNTSKENLLKSRSSLHRVSVVDWSFSISEKYQEVNDQSRKESIIDWLLKSAHESRAIKNQLGKLNEFLSKHGKKVEEADYIKFLKSWNLEDLKVPWLKIQKGKETRFLEARAMVAWNVCLNATYAIAYPAFELEWWDKQRVNSVSSVDYTAATNYAVVEWIESWIWLNPIAAALLRKWGWSWDPKWSTETTTPVTEWGWQVSWVTNAPNVAAPWTTTTTTTGTWFIKP